MKLKLMMALGVAVMVTAGACGGGQPEVAPGPDPDSMARERARADSIAAERARAEALADSIARAGRMEEERITREREEASRREADATAEVSRMLAMRVHFDFDRSDVRPGEDTEVLQQKVRILQANQSLQIEIVGHCDERGSDEYNFALGQRRAIASRDFLVNRGIDPSRITVRSLGEESPADPGHNEDAWAVNRRGEFTITAGGDQLVKPAGM